MISIYIIDIESYVNIPRMYSVAFNAWLIPEILYVSIFITYYNTDEKYNFLFQKGTL